MSCTDNLVDPQHGRKVHVSNRHVLRISCGTYFGRLLSVRARICHPLKLVSRSATALAKRLSGPHARPSELRDGEIESPDQCGDACVLWEQKVALANGTAKSVGSHSVSNIRCHGISVDDCATTEILVPGPETASNRQTSISVITTEPIKMPLKVAFSALIFSKSASYAYCLRTTEILVLRLVCSFDV